MLGNDAEGWAVGQNGFFLETDNGGASWEEVAVGTEEGLYKLRMRGDYRVVVGDHRTVLTTSDGGSSWVKDTANLRPPFLWLANAWIFTTLRTEYVDMKYKSNIDVLLTGNPVNS